MRYEDIRPYIGHMDQLFRVKEYRLIGGAGDGVRAVDIDNGAGLEITVLADRCMDFYQIKYMGKSTNYIAPCGIASPNLSGGFLDKFFAGFLTTCGLCNIGSPSEDQGEPLPLHGGLSSAAAEDFSVNVELIDGAPCAVVSGRMRQAALFGSNLTLKRTITCRYGENKLSFVDEAVNEGYRTEPMMLLYHFNIGYPLLSGEAVLDIPSKSVTPRNAHAEKHLDRWREITEPAFPYEEMCYYHDIEGEPDGTAKVGVTNPKAGIGLSIRYNRDLLDHFVQWKQLGKGEYVMGLEPCNATINGRKAAREDGSLKLLRPGERQSYHFDIAFFNP